jgi:hypothetical protein
MRGVYATFSDLLYVTCFYNTSLYVMFDYHNKSLLLSPLRRAKLHFLMPMHCGLLTVLDTTPFLHQSCVSVCVLWTCVCGLSHCIATPSAADAMTNDCMLLNQLLFAFVSL